MNSSGNHHAATEADFTPLAMVGMGGIFPQAENLMQFWRNIRDGEDSITEIPSSHWNPDESYDPDPTKPDHVYGKKGGFLPPVEF
ncbi:MAG: beta-ketoacyl synthase N-terminal-like domain-containing protein, partial [Mariprofundaceae bacterium]|nr:beta-ketoacyl synthase N-terminal-like domain-containing protein [Mariprofundaceae bacterium]